MSAVLEFRHVYKPHYRDLTKSRKLFGGLELHVFVIEILRTKSDGKDNPGKNNATEDPEIQRKPKDPFI